MSDHQPRLRQLAYRFPFLLNHYRRYRDSRWQQRSPRETPFGFAMTGHEDMVLGRFEPVETKVVTRLMKQADRFINVGANVGYYVCHALHAGLPTLAIEPLHRNLTYLLRNIAASRNPGLAEVFPVAVAEAPGVCQLYGSGTGASLIPGWANGPRTRGQPTPVNSLDNLLGERFESERLLFLVDVEGVEHRVLAGAVRTLIRAVAPTWVIEVSTGEHDGGANPHFLETFRAMWAAGYDAYSCDQQLRHLPQQEVEAAASNPRSVGRNNFVFRRKDAGR